MPFRSLAHLHPYPADCSIKVCIIACAMHLVEADQSDASFDWQYSTVQNVCMLVGTWQEWTIECRQPSWVLSIKYPELNPFHSSFPCCFVAPKPLEHLGSLPSATNQRLKRIMHAQKIGTQVKVFSTGNSFLSVGNGDDATVNNDQQATASKFS